MSSTGDMSKIHGQVAQIPILPIMIVPAPLPHFPFMDIWKHDSERGG